MESKSKSKLELKKNLYPNRKMTTIELFRHCQPFLWARHEPYEEIFIVSF